MTLTNAEQLQFGAPSRSTYAGPTQGTSGSVARSDHNHGIPATALITSAVATASNTADTNGTAVTIVPATGFSQFVGLVSLNVASSSPAASGNALLSITATFSDGTTSSAVTITTASSAFNGKCLLGATGASSGTWTGSLSTLTKTGQGVTQYSLACQSDASTDPFGASFTVYGTQV